MKFTAEIDIMPLPALLDPQGKTVGSSMKNLGLNGINKVRIGKHISFEIDADDEANATDLANEACTRLLVNEIMEFYTLKVVEVETINQ